MSRLLATSFAVLFSLSLPLSLAAQQTTTASAELRAAANNAWSSRNWAEASASYRKVVAANPKNGQAWHRLGYALHAQGKLDEALKAHVRATAFPQFAPVGAYNVACVHALRGKADEAFQWLDKAAAFGMSDGNQLANDTDLDSLHADARWQSIVDKFAKNAKRPQLQAFVQNEARQRNRVAWFGGGGGAGQLSIEHGPVAWNERFAKLVGSEQAIGKKWRLGSNFWTSLDTSLDLSFGDVEVPAGYYYMTLEQRSADRFVLALHDAGKVRKQKLDAFQAPQLQGGIEIPLAHDGEAEVQPKLSIGVVLDLGQDRGHLQIAIGPHRLTAAVAAKLDS